MTGNDFFSQKIQRRLARHFNNWRIFRMALKVARQVPPAGGSPVVFFKASTGIDDFSWNSAFHLLSSWALRLRGAPVVYFACNHGMSRCVIGTDRDYPEKLPPCRSCVYQSRTLYTGAQVGWFGPGRDAQLEAAVAGLSVRELSRYERDGIPLGALVLPGLRWILRRHHLSDDEKTRFFLREYILSAWNVLRKFELFLDEVRPRAVVVFNGQFYPEAVARWAARRRGLRVITHEVGLQPASAFFTEGEATAYPIHIPGEFEMDAEQDARLDAYLEKRFQGNFTMAGIKFWTGMKGLDEAFLQKVAGFRQVVPVFTNVIFDTSQPHANTLFEDMFVWLDLVLEMARVHRETLFVIRAHPDETRLRKASLETVAGWVADRRADEEPNVIFVPPHETLSSYELIGRSKFVMIYNSTIGLEAAILGAAVLCAGRARFTQYPTVFYPASADEYRAMLERFLAAEKIDVPAEFRRNARRFLYYQLFRTSLPFGAFLGTGVRTTHARLRMFDPALLAPDKSPALEAVLRGLLEDGDFLLKESFTTDERR
jgi:hypothetical protein